MQAWPWGPGFAHHLLHSPAPLPGEGRRRTGQGRCQQAPGTVSSWPGDPGTETFSSNQGADSIEQKCHGLKPRGVGGSKKRREEFSGLSPRGLLCGARQRGKRWAEEQREHSFLSGQAAPSAVPQRCLLWSLPPPPCLDGILLAALSPAFGLWSPRPALWLHLGALLAQGNLLKTNPTKESKKE